MLECGVLFGIYLVETYEFGRETNFGLIVKVRKLVAQMS